MKKGYMLITLTCSCLFMVSVAPASKPTSIYRIPAEAKYDLLNMETSVHHGRLHGDLIVDLTLEEVERLSSLGFKIKELSPDIPEEALILGYQDGTDEIHTYDQILTNFQGLESAYPEICRFEHFGYSVQNRELFGLRITTNPLIEEDEPELVFWGSIHGNERAAAEMVYLYANYLCENYGVDPTVTENIQNNEIWCVPIINPDGHAANSRYNANNIDLNREFGYNWDGWGFSPYPFSQPESRAVRELGIANNPVLSVSYHCSGDEYYYPWGYFPHPAPDYDILTRVGERYANAASYAFMSSFQSYQTHGEILDWAYGCLGGLSYTAEVSNSSSMVPTTFDRNRPGMDLYCSIAGEGLHGTVTDMQTGDPLHAAVWIVGDPIPAYTDPEVGDFHRVVMPGNYDIVVWANGYLPQSIIDIQVSLTIPGEFQAELQPGGESHAFMVTSVNQDDPNNNYNNATYPAWALGEPDDLPCSIGSGGFIVLDMGSGHEIIDGPGDDFTVTEVIHPRDPDPEAYEVYAGDAYEQNRLVGIAVGTASFDLAIAGIPSTQYLKIVDVSGSSPSFALAGMDLDGITVLNGHETEIGSNQPERNSFKPESLDLNVFPNPFNPKTEISFEQSEYSHASLKVYDISGRVVADLADEWLDAGNHSFTLSGSELASGMYFCRLQTGGKSKTLKVMLLK